MILVFQVFEIYGVVVISFHNKNLFTRQERVMKSEEPIVVILTDVVKRYDHDVAFRMRRATRWQKWCINETTDILQLLVYVNNRQLKWIISSYIIIIKYIMALNNLTGFLMSTDPAHSCTQGCCQIKTVVSLLIVFRCDPMRDIWTGRFYRRGQWQKLYTHPQWRSSCYSSFILIMIIKLGRHRSTTTTLLTVRFNRIAYSSALNIRQEIRRLTPDYSVLPLIPLR